MRLFVLFNLITVLCLRAVPGFAQDTSTGIVKVAVLDHDGDGIMDDVDACPEDAGPANQNPVWNGCTAHALAKQWIVAFIVKNSPPGHRTYFKDAIETKDEALERYNDIADDLIATVYDPAVKPLFAGPQGRTRTVSLLLGIMFWETGFRRDVDYGLGKYSRGDHGRSWCLMQINIGKGKTPDGLTGEDLVQHRQNCFREGLRVVRGSMATCRGLPLSYRLSAYASGSCGRGRDKSRQRVDTGMSWYATSKKLRPFNDADIMREMSKPDLQKELGPIAISE